MKVDSAGQKFEVSADSQGGVVDIEFTNAVNRLEAVANKLP
jgi:uncharacterized protein YuzE